MEEQEAQNNHTFEYRPELKFFCSRLKRSLAYQECTDNFKDKKLPGCSQDCITGKENAESYIKYMEAQDKPEDEKANSSPKKKVSKETKDTANKSRENIEPKKVKTGAKTKKCFKCKEFKTIDHFNKNKNTSDGLQWQCKDCGKKYDKNRKSKKSKNRICLDFTECPDLFEKVKKLSEENFRSFNAQIFYMIKTYIDIDSKYEKAKHAAVARSLRNMETLDK